ncbi:unnamed protein product [Lymnaea stagnalis]|uniref:C2HC/C3H-type domain-containing protein n=1 Tax=Lymnaea stagnalis TaxID=6523 RepID=A0AAV2H1M8_LYMST
MLSSQPYPPSPHRTRRLTKDLSPDADMRGLGAADTQAGRKPSKLELMRADYQRKLLKEKEEKMVQLYEDNQKKAMMRVTRNGSGNGRNGIVTPPGTVRDFFNERRRLAATGMPMPTIDNHYKQAKGSSSPGDWSNRTGSGNSVHAQKVSAGRDRSQPLVPIQRGGDEATNNNNTSGIPIRRAGSSGHVDKNPFDSKPRLVKHAPLPPTNGYMDKNNNDGATGAKPSHLPRFTPQNRSQPQPTSQKALHKPHPPAEPRGPSDQGKLTDFQKWQLEQNKVREKRLKKLNHKQHVDDNEGAWADPEEEPRFAMNLEETNDQDDEDGEDGEGESHVPNAKIKELEKQLLDKIAREQAELKRLKMERQKEEEEEKREMERQKKKEAAERAKQKKQEEERRKEEDKRRRKEEADEKLEREREERRERQQMEEERQRKEEEKKRLKMTNSRHKEENEGLSDEDDDDVPPSKTSSGPQARHQAKQKPKVKTDDLEETALSVSDANYYAQAAASSEAKGQVGSLAKCNICGRSFAHDRIQKHRDACAKASKPRKEFDSSKKRVEGTELAKYAGKAKKNEPPKKKSNWRTHHEQFIESLRYAKKVTQIEKEGGDLRSLAPPPRTVNPDLVPCPHCGRTFNETAAERHIPRCQTLKTRPAPVNTRRR